MYSHTYHNHISTHFGHKKMAKTLNCDDYKDHSTSKGNHVSTTYAPRCRVRSNWRGILNPIDHCTVYRSIQWELFKWTTQCSFIPRDIFHLELFGMRDFHILVSNMDNSLVCGAKWGYQIYCRWDNSTEVCVKYVIIHRPEWKLWPLI